MRIVAAVISLIAVAIVIGSAAVVLTREDQPRLAVNVSGVPGYVYYERTYDLTIEYANHGGAVSGPVELSAVLPPTFALAEDFDDPVRHGERLVWQLDGLDAGETGSVAITVRGTLPADLTDAVYDLPGYEGHTAFVEGFELAVALTADDASADALAVADTGAPLGGEITIIKSAGPGADADFTFSILASGDQPCEDGSFTLNDGSPATDSESFTGCAIGVDYVVTETGEEPGWEFDSIACALNSGSVTFVENGPSVTITLNEAGSQGTCAFTNVEEGLGSITIIKDTNPETNNVSFDFDSDFGDFDLDDDEPIEFDGLADTTYSFVENPPPGWAVVDIICNADDYNTDIPDGGLVVELQEGEDVTCTFVNEEDATGTIIIEKDVDPEPDGTDFSFGDDIPGCAIGTLDDDAGGATPNAVTCSNVPAGDYIVTESNPSPYVLVHIDCDDADDNTTVSGSSAFIDLDPGETVHCVFRNHPQSTGTITIVKDTEPETSGIVFDFDSPVLGDFDLVDDGFRTFTGLSSGVYLVSENPPSGWRLLNIQCDDGDASYNGAAVFIEVDPGDNITCVFLNVPTVPVVVQTPVVAAPTKTPAPAATSVPIAAPSAGDGGLADPGSNEGVRWVMVVVAGLAGAVTVVGYIRMLSRRA